MITEKEFEEYLVSINGLKNGYYPDRPNIVSNICECNNGWLELIKNLIEELIAAGWNKEICQIKEKFGGLRFYINEGSDEVFDIISKYESLSYKTCELCGEPGETRSGNWIRTLCEEHAEGRPVASWKINSIDIEILNKLEDGI